jgi:hypothetical protein
MFCVLYSEQRESCGDGELSASQARTEYGKRKTTSARRIDLMERTEELTEVSKSMNSGTIINSNFGAISSNRTSVYEVLECGRIFNTLVVIRLFSVILCFIFRVVFFSAFVSIVLRSVLLFVCACSFCIIFCSCVDGKTINHLSPRNRMHPTNLKI